jgi:hypothetical protein
LAELGYYPIPPAVIALGMTPAEHRQRELLAAIAIKADTRLPLELPTPEEFFDALLDTALHDPVRRAVLQRIVSGQLGDTNGVLLST